MTAIEELNAKVEFQESAVDFFRQEAMEKEAEILHLKEHIKRMKGVSEEESESGKKATCKPGAKGRKSRRPPSPCTLEPPSAPS